MPNPKLAKDRAPSGNANPGLTPMNSFPRIAADPNGAIYLTFRTPVPGHAVVRGSLVRRLARGVLARVRDG